MAEIFPPFLIEGIMKTEMKALRAKSPDPPIPFMMREPIRWVELMLP